MAKNGFRIMDSDLHVIEPEDLYQRYLEEPFKERAPRREWSHVSGLTRWNVDGRVFPYDGIDRRDDARLMAKKESTSFQAEAYKRNFDASSTLEAMDIEGVEVAALFRTHGMIGQVFDDMEPEYAAALCRAFNSWIAEYCRSNPERLRGVAIIPLNDMELAVGETLRAVKELGLVGISVHPDPVNGRVLFDP